MIVVNLIYKEFLKSLGGRWLQFVTPTDQEDAFEYRWRNLKDIMRKPSQNADEIRINAVIRQQKIPNRDCILIF